MLSHPCPLPSCDSIRLFTKLEAPCHAVHVHGCLHYISLCSCKIYTHTCDLQVTNLLQAVIELLRLFFEQYIIHNELTHIQAHIYMYICKITNFPLNLQLLPGHWHSYMHPAGLSRPLLPRPRGWSLRCCTACVLFRSGVRVLQELHVRWLRRER